MSITFEHNPLTFSFSGPTRRAYRYIELKLFVETALHFNESAIDIGDSCLEKRGSHSMRHTRIVVLHERVSYLPSHERVSYLPSVAPKPTGRRTWEQEGRHSAHSCIIPMSILIVIPCDTHAWSSRVNECVR